MASNSRITENLTWTSLKDKYFIGTANVAGEKVLVDNLRDAIADGSLRALFEDCANTMHDGDLQVVVEAMKRNLSSQACNMNKRMRVGYSSPDTITTDKIRLAELNAFVDTLAKEHHAGSKAVTSDKPQWAYGIEEIDQINDPDVLKKVINSIADPCSDSKNSAPYIARFGENYREVVIANRDYARARLDSLKNQKPATPVSQSILDKVANGKKTFTAAEIAELAEILKNSTSK